MTDTPKTIKMDSTLPTLAHGDPGERTRALRGGPDGEPVVRLHAGDELGPFVIQRYLGGGGAGIVYLASDKHLKRKVALKFLLEPPPGAQHDQALLLAEAQATARLNHPNIVGIHSAWWHGDHLCLALEFVDGHSIKAHLEQTPVLSPAEAIHIARQIASALCAAHHEGIVHKDLKPSNVMLGDDGRVRVLDFGISHDVARIRSRVRDEDDTSDLTRATPIAAPPQDRFQGTPIYAAPEQWQEEPLTGAVDVWALGLLLWEMLEGMNPYPASSDWQVHMHFATSPTPVPSMARAVPASLRRLVEACLDKDPEGRPTMGVVHQWLVDLGKSQPYWTAAGEGIFPGLVPYHAEQTNRYFGRTAEIEDLVERLTVEPVLPVVGPSACGKSSFVRAGVIPRLQQKARWVVIETELQGDPWRELAGAILARGRARDRDRGRTASRGDGGHVNPRAQEELAKRFIEPEIALAAELRDTPHKLCDLLGQIAHQDGAQVLLFVDQLERVYWKSDSEEAKRFVDALLLAAVDPDLPVRVVLTLRDDLAWKLAAEGGAPIDAFSRPVAIGTLDPAQLRRVVHESIGVSGYRIGDSSLVQEMVEEVRGLPGSLALIQVAGSALWLRRDRASRTITRDDYDRAGGVLGAVVNYFEQAYLEFGEEARTTARRLLMRLGRPSVAHTGVLRSDLLTREQPGDRDLLDTLVAERFVLVGQDRREREPRYSLLHPSAAQAWPRMRRWMEAPA
jgi:eukaryotic-like serine/threonine-protein kinase